MDRMKLCSMASLMGTLLAGGLFCLRAAWAADPISFGPPTNYPVIGSYPTVVDLDGDQALDIVMRGNDSNTGSLISVLYGRGDGTFENAVAYPVNVGFLVQVIGADIDEDGRLDLVAANENAGAVTILRSTGFRTFVGPAQAQHISVGSARPFGVNARDFNGDGHVDIAVTVHEGNRLVVLLGNGAGGFTRSANLLDRDLPARVVSADFNEDGRLDLATSHYGSSDVRVFLGNGNGTFVLQRARYFVGFTAPIDTYAAQIVTEDFNQDGHADLATANYNDGSISILYGNGNGTFQNAANYPVGYQPHLMGSGDLDGDGDADLAIPLAGSKLFATYENRGTGWVQGPSITSDGLDLASLAVGDLNGDGRADVVAAHNGSPFVSVFLSVGPLAVQSVTIQPSSFIGGYQSAAGVVTLSRPAPAGGVEVPLSTTNTAVTVPASVVIAEGETQATFPVTAPYVTETFTGVVTATLNGSKSAPVTVRPISVASLSLSPNPASDGKKVIGTLTLDAPAAPGALTVDLSSSDPDAAEVRVETVTVAPGQTQVSFKIKTHQVPTTTQVTISATLHGITTSTVLTVLP